MRTTLTLDPDVVQFVQDAVSSERRPMKHVINDALRRAFTTPADVPRETYRISPHHTALRPGVDPLRMNQLVDEMEEEAVLGKMRQQS